MEELYRTLVEETRKNEDTNECPLILCGIFFNTVPDEKGEHLILDAESLYAGYFLWDADDLAEFLQVSKVTPEDIRKALAA